jgi:hypothetical protein
MLSEQNQMMIVNAACHAIAMNQETERMAIGDRMVPHVVLRAKIYPDGNQWCCLYGDDLQCGVAGFGDTPAKAANAFDTIWTHGGLTVLLVPTFFGCFFGGWRGDSGFWVSQGLVSKGFGRR